MEAQFANARGCRQPRPRPLAALRRYIGRWGLIIALLALPVYYGIQRPHPRLPAGFVNGHQVIHHDLSQLGFNIVSGLSNGSIWALIAMGYTLVYGIIELINFAHGDVFMIGSFVSVGLCGTFGLSTTTGAARPDRRAAADPVHRDARVRRR